MTENKSNIRKDETGCRFKDRRKPTENGKFEMLNLKPTTVQQSSFMKIDDYGLKESTSCSAARDATGAGSQSRSPVVQRPLLVALFRNAVSQHMSFRCPGNS